MIRLTPYGKPQTLWIAAGALIPALIVFFTVGLWPGIIVYVVSTVLFLAFFRDPSRDIPEQPGILLSPADGKVTDITPLDAVEFLDGPVIRIGIFLSVFDVHLNRTPCRGMVKHVRHQDGKCLNAMRSEAASSENQAVWMGLSCPDHPAGAVLVRQITGAIARRIVCDVKCDQIVKPGQCYGMIKFGSRTELFFPADAAAQVVIAAGQRVKAGETILVRYATGTQQD